MGSEIAWAESAWQRRVVRVRPLLGGWTSRMLALTAADGEEAVLRLMTKDPWRRHASGLLAREAAVQRQLAGSAIPAPRSLGVDLTGDVAGAPAHLMSRLPGRVRFDSATDGFLTATARLLDEIHSFDPGPDRPREYQSWAAPAKRLVPPWARRPALWTEAFTLLDQSPPAYAGVFLHRDFHPGNLLWHEDRITGVVDWVETSWGPRELDVAHAATYLAMLHGPEAAARFAGLCGHRSPADELRYWNVMDIVGYLPDPVKVAQPWRDTGLTISNAQARHRLEQRLADVLRHATRSPTLLGGPPPPPL